MLSNSNEPGRESSDCPGAEFSKDFAALFNFINKQFETHGDIPLSTPQLGDREKRFLANCIDTAFVGVKGPAINEFEKAVADFVDAEYAIALVNGTAALQLALLANGVQADTEVITTALTVTDTVNAITQCGAEPIFVDVDRDTLSLSPAALRDWLQHNVQLVQEVCVNRHSYKAISACVCTHNFGHPARLDEIKAVCSEFNLPLIEDAAQAFGSRYRSKPVGAQAGCGVFNFNANNMITTGAGGALVTNSKTLIEKARQLLFKPQHYGAWQSDHDDMGFDFNMPNLNAALGCAQLQQLDATLKAKRRLASSYQEFFANEVDADLWCWVAEPKDCESNYWLSTLMCSSTAQRDATLEAAARQRIQMSPSWKLLTESHLYNHCQRSDLSVTTEIANCLICLPSSVQWLRS